ncbi:MAG: hypothetical protein HYR81_00160 [Nitrospirae bacterium]|nr:hypothetical protein [Nitrospirota bacterium]
MTQTKKTLLLIFLALSWSGLFFYQYLQPGEKHVPLKYKKGEVPRESESRRPPELPVKGDLLKFPKKNLEITKNIFAPIYIPPPPKPRVEPPPPPPPVVLPPAPSPEELARKEAMRLLSEFKYLGYLNKGHGKEQGFFSRGGELLIVGKEEVITGSFILKSIDPNQAVLKDKATGVESTLVLLNQ